MSAILAAEIISAAVADSRPYCMLYLEKKITELLIPFLPKYGQFVSVWCLFTNVVTSVTFSQSAPKNYTSETGMKKSNMTIQFNLSSKVILAMS